MAPEAASTDTGRERGRPRGNTGLRKLPAEAGKVKYLAEAEGFMQKNCVFQQAPPSAFRARSASGPGFKLLATAQRFTRFLGLRVAEHGRTLRFATAACGTGAPTHVLEVLLGDRRVTELWASEVSMAAMVFMMRATKPLHICHGIGSTLSASSQAPCLLHGGAICRLPAGETHDLFIMGWPCQPKSLLDPGLFAGDAWPKSIHPDMDAFHNGVRHIKQFQPSTWKTSPAFTGAGAVIPMVMFWTTLWMTRSGGW
jgi:hypothetical protein